MAHIAIGKSRSVMACALACSMVFALIAGCASSGNSASTLPSSVTDASPRGVARQVFGNASVGTLTLESPAATDHPQVAEAVARQQIDHPLSAPTTTGSVLLFELARVTVAGGSLGSSGTGPIQQFDNRLAWVGIYEVARNGSVKCPAEPYSPSSLPPLEAHYYFAVLVDATDSTTATWQEDESGLTMRQCAGLPVQ